MSAKEHNLYNKTELTLVELEDHKEPEGDDKETGVKVKNFNLTSFDDTFNSFEPEELPPLKEKVTDIESSFITDLKNEEEIINIMDFNLDSITEESKTGYEAIASNGSEIKADESLDCFEYELDFTSKNSEQSESHDHIALDISNISDKSPIYAQSTSLNELFGNNLFQRNFYSNEPVTVNYDKQNNYFDLTDMETKLELVKAYIDMNDSDGAKATANEVLENGTAEQKKIAEALMKGLK
jgi:pilus assembly protein FimV